MPNGTSQPTLFARKASGLVREFGFFDTFSFNVIGYALGLVLAITPFFAGALFPGANIYILLILGTILAGFNGLTYSLLSGAMPRSGGEYIYNGRILHPAIGFMSNWGFSWSQFLGIGIYTMWCVNYAMSVTFATLGYAMKSEGLTNAGIWIGGKWPSFLVGTVILIAVVLVLLAGMRFLRRFLNVFFVLAIIGTILTFFVFLLSGRNELIQAFNDFMAKTSSMHMQDAYHKIIQLARDNGWHSVAPSFKGTLLALPLGYWVYIGFTYSVYVGGEVKEPQKTQTYAIIASLIFGFIFYMAICGVYYATVGAEFNNAAAYLEYKTKVNPIPVAGVMNLFAMLLTKNPLLIILIGISFFLWYFLLLFTMCTICVRNIFAWSFDKVMPLGLTKVTKNTRVPLTATIVVVIVAWILMWFAIFTPLFDYVFNYIAIFSIAFWITSFSAILLPYRRPELFQAAPSMVKARWFGVPLVTIAGVINLILFSIILYSSFALPAFSGPVGPVAIAFIIGIYLVGIIIYFAVAAYRKSKGVDLSLLYSEIPPE